MKKIVVKCHNFYLQVEYIHSKLEDCLLIINLKIKIHIIKPKIKLILQITNHKHNKY